MGRNLDVGKMSPLSSVSISSLIHSIVSPAGGAFVLLALSSCASTGGTQAELSDLKTEIQVIRDENAQWHRRVEKLESSTFVTQTHLPARTVPSAAAYSSDAAALPDLTVIKLKPKRQPAPKLSVETPVREPVEPTTDSTVLDAEVRRAIDSLKTGNVQGGVGRLEDFASAYPHHPEAARAWFYSGVGKMGLNDFEGAASSFEKILSAYSTSEMVPEAMLKLGDCRTHLHLLGEARALYLRIRSNYPGTDVSAEAEGRLAAFKK